MVGCDWMTRLTGDAPDDSSLDLGRGTVETGAGLEVDIAQGCLLDE